MRWLRGLTILKRLEGIEPSKFLLAKLSEFTDYAPQAATIFREETDMPQDIAEDVTREAIEAMGMSRIGERLYGKVDVKKAIYVFLPKPHQVALMLDAKAEKLNGDRTATIQMSQTSMTVKMRRSGQDVNEPGKLDKVIERGTTNQTQQLEI